MAIKFIIESASDISPELAEKLGLIHLSFKVIFGDKEYLDAVELTHKDFYEKLTTTDISPSTSQINPAEFEEAYQKVVANGDIGIVITVTGKLSGTYQSAMIAAADYKGKIFVVDSESVAIGERLLIMRGLELRDRGLSAEEIVDRLNAEKKKIRLFALLDTLKYVKRSGRVSSLAAFAGTLLSIKPVISMEDGLLSIAGKARGARQGQKLLYALMDKCGGINFEKPYYFAYTGLSDSSVKQFIADCPEMKDIPADQVPVSSIGAAIGTHAGPGAIAVAFFAK